MPAIQNTLLGFVVVAALAAPAYTQQSPSSPYGLPKTYDGVTLYYPDTGRAVHSFTPPTDTHVVLTLLAHAAPFVRTFQVTAGCDPRSR